MNLKTGKFIFIDCQTTGIRPPVGHLLEFAWAYCSAEDEPVLNTHVVQLPDGQEIPAMVREMTGLKDLTGARPMAEVFAKFVETLSAAGVGVGNAGANGAGAPGAVAIIHYAQFEKPYLADLYSKFTGAAEIPFAILCSHQMTKKIFPNLPSQNIRGAAGFFGMAPHQLKRAGHHVAATHRIWRGIVEEVEKLGIHSLDDLKGWLTATPRKKGSRYEYKIDKLKRLDLPDSPGIYRMIAKTGEILYVGKATSLKSRVNSYFRGKKGRDTRKLEMMAQVWDLRVTDCATPLEAALLESDEIKKYNPPYNLVLKRGRRTLMFYNHDFSKASLQQSLAFPLGPFRNSNWIEHLRRIYRSLSALESGFEQIFFEPISPENTRAGFELFWSQQGVALDQIKSVRTLLARGMWLLKNYAEPEDDNTEETAENSAEETNAEALVDAELTPEEIAAKFERLLRRSAAEYRRGKYMTKLLNALITFESKKGIRRLQFNRGILTVETSRPPEAAPSAFPWSELAIDDFDRMSILLSELKKYDHTIKPNG